MYLSDKQIAARFGVSRPAIWKWAKTLSGFPQPVRLTPGCTRWKLADIEQWERSREGGAS